MAILVADMIAAIPPSLETLEFDGATFYSPGNETWWPDKLEKLVVSNLDCDCVDLCFLLRSNGWKWDV